MNGRLGRAAAAAGIVLATAASLAPFAWFAAVSFLRPVDVTATPPRPWGTPTLEAYRSALFEHDLLGAMAQSATVASLTTAATVSLATLAAYAIARLGLPGGRGWLFAALGASMLPPIALAGPLWRMLRAAGLLNSVPGLALPYTALALPLAIWILASFFRDLPRELEQAALVDGCTPLGALVRVVLPVAAPGVFTAAILTFIFAWNEFFIALLVLSDPERFTLPLAIALFPGQYTMPWAEIAAASVVATLPVLGAVLVFQRRIVEGLLAGTVKG